jgi:hypothetical protein
VTFSSLDTSFSFHNVETGYSSLYNALTFRHFHIRGKTKTKTGADILSPTNLCHLFLHFLKLL